MTPTRDRTVLVPSTLVPSTGEDGLIVSVPVTENGQVLTIVGRDADVRHWLRDHGHYDPAIDPIGGWREFDDDAVDMVEELAMLRKSKPPSPPIDL